MKKKLLIVISFLMLLLIGAASAATPVANFTGTPVSGTVPLVVQFEDATPYNLLTYSEDFTQYEKTRSTVTANNTTAPDGTTTADKFILDGTAAASHRIRLSTTLAASTDYVYSVYAKSSNHSWIELKVDAKDGTNPYGFYNLTGGVVGSAGGGGYNYIESLGDGWYKCILVFPSGTGATSPSVYVLLTGANTDAFDGDSVSGVWLWGSQLVVKPTTDNLLYYTEHFENNYWTKYKSSISEDVATAPDGSLTADKMIESTVIGSTGENDHYVAPVTEHLSILSDDTVYTYSVYLKPAGRNWVDIGIWGREDVWKNSYFNIATGTLGITDSNVTTTITPAGNGWYQCTLTFDTTSGASPMLVYTMAGESDGDCQYNGDGVSGFYIWGAQLEAGTSATAYTPSILDTVTYATTGSAVIPVITGWSWDFGDGSTSTSQNPTHTYTGVGLFDVTLTSTNADGSDSELKADYINAYSAYAHTLPATTAGTMIVGALTLLGISLVGCGALGLIYMFSSITGGSPRYSRESVLTTGSIVSILLGAVLLMVTYTILSPLFTVAGI